MDIITPTQVLGIFICKLDSYEPGLVKVIMGQVVMEITASGTEDPEFIEKYRKDIKVIIHIPPSLTTFRRNAFKGCPGLIDVHFPHDGALTTIFYDTFAYCAELTELHFPASLEFIGAGAFYGCTGLTELHFPDNSTLTAIYKYAFQKCTGLTEIHFPHDSALATFGIGAFADCTGLNKVHFPASLTTIGNGGFAGCTGLTELHFPHDSALATIDDYAFFGCTGLTKVYCSDAFRDRFCDKFHDNAIFHTDF